MMRELFVSYAAIKSIIGAAYSYYRAVSTGYELYLINANCFATCALCEAADIEDFEENYKALCRAEVPSRDDALILGSTAVMNRIAVEDDGLMRVAPLTSDELRATCISHNFCDPCTWYTEAEGVTSEALTPNETRTVFSSAHTFWIDLAHGRLSDEDEISAHYLPVVKVDGVTKTERTPFATEGGDFIIDYEAGTVTFAEAVGENLEVTASYHYANGSSWKMAPTTGKILTMLSSKGHFSLDAVLNDTIMYTCYGYVEIFAPALAESNGGPIPDGTKIPLESKKYKTFIDMIQEANTVHPQVPAIGGTVRGLENDVLELGWIYKGRTDLYAGYGMEIVVKMQEDAAATGELGSITFECLSRDE